MRRRLAVMALAAAAVLGLASCATPGPDRPQAQVIQPGELGIPGGASPAAHSFEAWWKPLGDAQLAALIESALEGSPDLRAAEARVRAAASQERLAQSAARAGVSANAHATRQRFSENYIFPPPLGGSWITDTRATLDVDYDFDLWHRHEALIAASAMRREALEADRESARLVLSVTVAATYASLQSAFEALDIAREREAVQQRLLALAEEAAKRGVAPGSLVEPRLAALSGGREEAAAIEARIRMLQNELATLAGVAPAHWRDVPRVQVALPDAMREPRELPADFLGRRADIAAQRHLIEASYQEAAAARADFYPNIDLAAFVGLQSISLQELLNPGSRTLGIGPALHLPIFSQGSLRAQLGARYAEYDAAVETYNRLVLDAVREVADRDAQLVSDAKQIEAANAQLASIERIAQASEVRRRHGLAGDQPVLEGRLAVLDQRARLVALRNEQLVAAFGLVKALGGGYDRGVQPVANREQVNGG